MEEEENLAHNERKTRERDRRGNCTCTIYLRTGGMTARAARLGTSVAGKCGAAALTGVAVTSMAMTEVRV